MANQNWWTSVYTDDGSLLSFRRYTYYISIVGLAAKALLFLLLVVSLFMLERKPKYAEPTNIGVRN